MADWKDRTSRGSEVVGPSPRLRPDLRVVYENAAPGQTRMRLVDPATGRQFTFSEQEGAACQAADGAATIPEIAATLARRFEAPLGPREVEAFFRRLLILGLIAPPPDPLAAPPVAARRRASRGQNPIALAGPTPTVTAAQEPPAAESPRPAPGRLGPSFAAVEAPGPASLGPEATPAPRDAEGAGSPAAGPHPRGAAALAGRPPRSRAAARVQAAWTSGAERPGPARAAPEAPTAPEAGPAAVAAIAPAVPRERPAAPVAEDEAPSAATAAAPRPSGRASPQEEATSPTLDREAKAAVAAPGPASPHSPAAEAAVPRPSENLAAVEGAASPVTTPRRARTRLAQRQEAAGRLAAAPPPPAPPDRAEDADSLDVIAAHLAPLEAAGDRFAPEPRARLGGRGALLDEGLGGARPGLGGAMGGGLGALLGRGAGGGLAGLGGGGLGGGGLGGGLGGMGGGQGRERLMAMLAARQGLGPGAAPAPAENRPASVRLFNPLPLLRVLYVLFYPLRFVLWAIVPLITLAGLTIVQNWGELSRDLVVLVSGVTVVTHTLASLLTVNLASRLAQGVAVVAHGGRPDGMGLHLVGGILPRFWIDGSAIPGLDRRGRLWAYGAPLLSRLAIFALGTLTWAVTRDGGTWLPDAALVVAQFGLLTFLLDSSPLIPGDGMRFVGAYLDEPRLMRRMVASTRHLLTGRPLPPGLAGLPVAPFAFYGVTMALSAALLGGWVAVSAAMMLEAELGGTGVTIFLGLILASVLWLLAVWAGIGRRRGARLAGLDAGTARLLTDPAAWGVAPGAEPGAEPEAEAAPAPSASGVARILWSVILVGLLAVMVLPYDYQTGGLVDILPAGRSEAVARSDGEIIEVLVADGDAVTEGQEIARLSSWNQERERDVTAAELDGARATLDRLLAGPKPEEVEVARRQVASAEASLAFSQAEAERARELSQSGAVPTREAEEKANQLDTDTANLEVARAQLELVESGATPEEVAVARADVERLERELAFRQDEVDRTRILAPMAGRVVTPDLEFRRGSFLREGDVLLEVEDASTVTAAIEVPEADIPLVEPGDAVRLRIRGLSDDEIEGRVSGIATVAEDAEYGNVVRVEARVPNPEGLLRSGMTGYAKVDGAPMRVWEAYLRSIMRFFQVEVWSWIP